MLNDEILQVKKQIDQHIGSKVRIKANKGRKKIVINEGVIENTYPSIFVVKVPNELNNSYRTISYSYTDLITHDVKVSVYNKE